MALLSVGVLVERRYRTQRQPEALVAALRRRRHLVEVIDPRETVHRAGDDDWFRSFDVVVARGRSWDLLTLLSAAEAAGVPTVNRREAIGSVHNKAEMAIRLTAANLPTPHTYIGRPSFLAEHVAAEDFPLIVKPIFGDNSRGLRVFCSAGDLRTVKDSDAMIAQQFLLNDGFDVKLYAIGGDVWAVRKPSPLTPASDAPQLVAVTAQAREIARRCGTLFGLDLFGVDCIETPRGLAVIEVNEFPNYSSVPDAGDRIADHLERHLERAWSAAS